MPKSRAITRWRIGEKLSITGLAKKYPLKGYRRLAFMMLDADMVAVSPSSVYRVLKEAGLLQSPWQNPVAKAPASCSRSSRMNTGTLTFSYVNLGGTFYYLCSILEGASRFSSCIGKFAKRCRNRGRSGCNGRA